MVKAKYKPLSFTTTLRNPRRMVDFLMCMSHYEGYTLSHDIIMKICEEVIIKKVYYTNFQMKNSYYKSIYLDPDKEYSEDEAKDIIANSQQKHKERGYEHGWESRFDTWFYFIKELGLCYYEKDKQIVITMPGHMLIDAYNEEAVNEQKIRKVFLNALVKYQSNNPFRKQLNANAPLILLLNAIREFRKRDNNFKGFKLYELSFFICWPDDNYKKIVDYIVNFRNIYGYNVSEDVVYEKSLDLLGADETKTNYYKKDKICGEAVDEYVRKMRLTGLLSLRGQGRYIDENKSANEVVDYIVAVYKYEKFYSVKEYFDYVSKIDQFILDIKDEEEDNLDLKIKVLEEYSSSMTFNEIVDEINICCSKRSSTTHPVLKFMNEPLRLEFLISVLIKNKFKYLKVIPSYPIDDEGLPRSTAGGGKADVVCYDCDYNELVEVTLQNGKINQVNNEIIPIRRHLLEALENDIDTFSIFIANNLHPDASECAAWYKYKDGIDILTYSVSDFCLTIKNIELFQNIIERN